MSDAKEQVIEFIRRQLKRKVRWESASVSFDRFIETTSGDTIDRSEIIAETRPKKTWRAPGSPSFPPSKKDRGAL